MSGDDQAAKAKDLGWLLAGPSLPRGRWNSLLQTKRPYLVYRRSADPNARVTFRQLRDLLKAHGF